MTKRTNDHINRFRKKHLTKFYIQYVTKDLSTLGIKENINNRIKGIYEKPIANVVLNGENLIAFCLTSETRQGCLVSPLLFNIVLEF